MSDEKPILDYSPPDRRRKSRIRGLFPLIVALLLFASLIIYVIVTISYEGLP